MSSWLWTIFYCTETEIWSKNAEQAQYRVNRLLQAFRFFQVCLQLYIFLHPKALKIQTRRGEISGFKRVFLWRAVTTRLWPGHNKNNFFFVPNSKQKYRGATMPQITIGAKEQWQPYSGDLSIIVLVRYHTHTHTHTHKHKQNSQTQNTHAPMRNQH